jgi:hypothetical protein
MKISWRMSGSSVLPTPNLPQIWRYFAPDLGLRVPTSEDALRMQVASRGDSSSFHLGRVSGYFFVLPYLERSSSDKLLPHQANGGPHLLGTHLAFVNTTSILKLKAYIFFEKPNQLKFDQTFKIIYQQI